MSKFPRRILNLLVILSLAGSCFAAGYSAVRYPEFSISGAPDNRLVLTYRPEISEDLKGVARLARYSYQGNDIYARAILLAVPVDGDVELFTSSSLGGSIETDQQMPLASADMPIAVKGETFFARGHKLVQILIFPMRGDEKGVSVYKEIVCEIQIRGTIPVEKPLALSRLDTLIARTTINPDQFFAFGSLPRVERSWRPVQEPFTESEHLLKVTVGEEGIYRITGADLANAGINLTELEPATMRLFYAGGIIPPASFSDPQLELYEIAAMVADGNDGRFDSGDYLLFYGQAVNRFDFASGEPAYIKNHYSRDNVYWLSWGGDFGSEPLRWGTTTSESGSPDAVVSSEREIIRVEQEHILKVDGDGHTRNHYEWYWSDAFDVVASINMPGLVTGDSIFINLSALADFSGSTLSLNGVAMSRIGGSGSLYRFALASDVAIAGLNTVQIHLASSSRNPYLNYLEVNYPRSLQYSSGQMLFNSYGHAGRLQFRVDGIVADMTLLDLSNPDRPATIEGITFDGTVGIFQYSAGPIPARFVAYRAANVLTPEAISLWNGENLRLDLGPYDGLVISPRHFQEALAEYAGYRQSGGNLHLKLVAIEDIYDQFGYGLPSPLAIRNFLRFAFETYTPAAPYGVLLAGDGHYDFLDHLGMHNPSFIPPFIWEADYSAGDDNYVYFGDYGRLDSDSSYQPTVNRGWDMMIARWPVRSPGEIGAYVEKLTQYESADAGGWRGRVTFVADDEFKGSYSTEIIHTAQAETLAVYHTPPAVLKKKIYATDYPFASSGEKPAVNDAIIKAINDGTLIINYIGHGSQDVWADEHILKAAADLGRLRNFDKPTIVVAGSCSIGRFDQPSKEGMAELMFRQEGGAIETVSATRLVYSRDNAVFSYDLYDGLFGGAGNVSEAVFMAKMYHQYTWPNQTNLLVNDRAYIVFGDPFGRLGLPEYGVAISPAADSVLTPLAPFAFQGEVKDSDGQVVNVEGWMDVEVYDSRYIRHHPLGIDYSLGGPRIFRGTVAVNGGRLSGTFMVPLDIDYGGTDAQMVAFGSFGAQSALGGMTSLGVAGQPALVADDTGPAVDVTVDGYPGFSSGDRIPVEATLIVTLVDQSGINLTGNLGHRIELVVDGDNNSQVNLTDLFSYDPGSYQTGTVRYTLPDLTPGLHRLKISAWDNANNYADREIEVTAAQSSRIEISDVLNYPNPMEASTEFFFELSEPAEWAELQIFTLAGRKIKALKINDIPLGRNRRFFWDGRDLDGDRVAQGVYLYRIIVKGRVTAAGPMADNISEAYGKLVLLN